MRVYVTVVLNSRVQCMEMISGGSSWGLMGAFIVTAQCRITLRLKYEFKFNWRILEHFREKAANHYEIDSRRIKC